MARLPNPGGDAGQWGQVLNEYLSVGHASDGTVAPGTVQASALSDGAVSSASIADGSVSEVKLDPALLAKVNAIGDPLLAGDVTGTFSASVVSGIKGVAVTGSPSAGQVVKATSSTDAIWQSDALMDNVYVATADVTARAGDVILADVSNGSFTITLPAPVAGAVVRVKMSDGSSDDAATVSVVATGSATIDGGPGWSADVLGGQQTFTCDGTNWFLSVASTVIPPDPPGGPSNARWTGEFLDSIGISAALNDPKAIETPDAKLVEMVDFLGVKRLRTGIPLGTTAEVATAVARFNALVGAGCKTVHVLSPLGHLNINNHDMILARINQVINFLTNNPTIAAGAYAVEYFNELDHARHGDPLTFDDNIAFGLPKLWELSSGLRASGIKVLAPALVGYRLGSTDNDAVKLKTTFDAANTQTMEHFFDLGNLHSYTPAGALPETSLPSKMPDEIPSGWPTQFADVAPVGGSKNHTARLKFTSWYFSRQEPILITEANSSLEGTELTDPGINLKRLARSEPFVPRILLENFRIGVKHTYIFNLVMYNGYGLFGNSSQSYAVNPAGTALHNLTTILADSAPSYTPSGTLDYTVPSGVRHVLLQKSDGTFWLCLWKSLDYTGSSSAVTLTFTTPQTIQQYQDLSTTPLAAAGPNTTFSVTIGPKVSIFKVT